MATADGPYVPTDGQAEYVSPLVRGYEAPTDAETERFRSLLGWAPKLDQTLDPSRTQQIPRRDYRPEPNRPPDEWWGKNYADTTRRESVQKIDADGWEEVQTREVRAPDPRWYPPSVERLTAKMAPRSYLFLRPWGENFLKIAKQFNGIHFSMADHRRTYDILGMAPARSLRNTYRADPPPWDENLIDMPPEYSPVDGTIRAVDVPPSTARSNRTWRL
jgi:hypothetical protein